MLLRGVSSPFQVINTAQSDNEGFVPICRGKPIGKLEFIQLTLAHGEVRYWRMRGDRML